MTVWWYDVELDGAYVVAETVKFMVGMNVTYVVSACLIKSDNGAKFAKEHVLGSIGYMGDSAETETSGDGVKKRYALHEKKVHTYGDVEVVCKDRWWNRYRFERGNTGSSGGPGVFPFNYGNVGSVDDECTCGVSWGDGTVTDVVIPQD